MHASCQQIPMHVARNGVGLGFENQVNWFWASLPQPCSMYNKYLRMLHEMVCDLSFRPKSLFHVRLGVAILALPHVAYLTNSNACGMRW